MSSASISNPGATASITSATAVSLSLGSWDVQVADIAARAAYNSEAAGFSVLVSDTGSGRAAVYTKNSATSGDWSDPAYYTGPTGATGATGPAGADGIDGADGADGNGFLWRAQWALYTDYAINDVAFNNDVSYVCVATHIAAANDEPGIGAGWAAKWDVFNYSNMLASIYDPTAVVGDAFDMDNMVEGTDTKIMTAAERTRLGISPVYVATRTALKALSTSTYTVAVLTESGREGAFIFRSGDYSSYTTADTAEAVYLVAGDTAATSGAWVREFDFLSIPTRWAGGDWQAAIDIAYTAGVPVVTPTEAYTLTSSTGALAMRPGVSLHRFGSKVSITQAASTNLSTLIEWATHSADGASLLGGITLDGNAANNVLPAGTEWFGLYIAGADDVTVENNTIKDIAGHGAYVNTGTSPRIRYNTFQNCGGITVYILPSVYTYGTYGEVSHNFISGVGTHGISVTKALGTRVEKNTVTGVCNIGQTVDVSGTTVTWVSGPDFSNLKPGHFVIFNGGTERFIDVVNSSTSLTISSSGGTLTGVDAVSGSGDLILLSDTYNCSMIGNDVSNGASIGVDLVSTSSSSQNYGSIVSGNWARNMASCGFTSQTVSTGSVVGAQLLGNYALDCGLGDTAMASAANTGYYLVGGISAMTMMGNSSLAVTSTTMTSLYAGPSAAASIFLSDHSSNLSDKELKNAVSVSLSGWGNATATAKCYGDTFIVEVTNGTTAPSASASFTLTHNIVPPRQKNPVAVNTSTASSILHVLTYYPDTATQSTFVMEGTPGGSSGTVWRYVVNI